MRYEELEWPVNRALYPSTKKIWRSFAVLFLGKMRERNLSWGSGKSDSQLEVQTKGGHHNIGENGSSVGLQL